MRGVVAACGLGEDRSRLAIRLWDDFVEDVDADEIEEEADDDLWCRDRGVPLPP